MGFKSVLGLILSILGSALITFGVSVVIDHNVSGNGKEKVSVINYVYIVIGLIMLVIGIIIFTKDKPSGCVAPKGFKCIAIPNQYAKMITRQLETLTGAAYDSLLSSANDTPFKG